mmetsp:Transcript_11603/g.21058  ORF Transcript_11603/g.21058 Transcript_11603/m.21058 type:complete len:379 (+) Transcript_11603:324-1460(+)
MKTFSLAVIFLTVAPTLAHPNMRSLYRVNIDASDVSSAFHTDKGLNKAIRRELGLPMDMSMPIDAELSMPIDAELSMPMDADFSMEFPMESEFSMPSFAEAMSMPFTCDTVHECPTSCECNGNVADASEEICGCYEITSVEPPFDTYAAPASGTWYCFQIDLDKTAEGCSGAKEVSHSVLATGFSESCLFHPGGIDVGGTDNWQDVSCDNTAASGLKYDFGHSDITSGNIYSVTYCFDVSCEVAPAGQGSVDWVIKAGNDRCEIKVTEGALPNCGVSGDLCSPSCPADNEGDNNGGGNNVGGNNGGGNNKAVNDPSTETTSATVDGGSSERNLGAILGSVGALCAVGAIAGVAYQMAKKGGSAGADGASMASTDTLIA